MAAHSTLASIARSVGSASAMSTLLLPALCRYGKQLELLPFLDNGVASHLKIQKGGFRGSFPANISPLVIGFWLSFVYVCTQKVLGDWSAKIRRCMLVN